MDENKSLQRQSRELTASTKPSLEVSALTLAGELKLTAMNAKTDLDEQLVREFSRSLLDFDPECIREAFRAWRDESPFFPAVSDIRQLCRVWLRRKAEKELDAAIKQEKAKVEAARVRGDLIDFADIVKKLKDVAKMPESAQNGRKTGVVAQREMPPALPLTKEQIEQRREKELEEIRRYEEAQ